MPFLFQYLTKFSLSLLVLYAFYYVLLRPLTFYKWNRFYLLCYSLLSFIIPFINVTAWVPENNVVEQYLINSVPMIEKLSEKTVQPIHNSRNALALLLTWNVAAILFITGACLVLIRFAYQYSSLRSIKRKAVLIRTGDFELYDVNSNITPFSFANSIFINSRLHSEEEFHKILAHEFIHVKQKHTIDIIAAELICILNWFNPFAWFIRRAIRQNLEFIADNNVLKSGVDALQYQYLLLKVMGVSQYTITNHFSISSLKKRILMMNKLQTARVHLVKFLFILPLLIVMLLAFRTGVDPSINGKSILFAGLVVNASDDKPLTNMLLKEENSNVEAITDSKGFFKFSIPASKDGEQLIIRVLKNGSVKRTVSMSIKARGSTSFLGIIGIDGNSSDTLSCTKCFTNFMALPKYVDNFNVTAYKEVSKLLNTVLQQNKDAEIINQTDLPIIIIREKIYILSGAGRDKQANKVNYSSVSFDLNVEKPLFYVDGNLSSIEKVNASLTRADIKSLRAVGEQDALKKYGTKDHIIEINTFSGVGSDTIPGKVTPLNKTVNDRVAVKKTDSVKTDSINISDLAGKENAKSLLRKLPGIEIDEKGFVKAQGVAVQKVIIDGVQVAPIKKTL